MCRLCSKPKISYTYLTRYLETKKPPFVSPMRACCVVGVECFRYVRLLVHLACFRGGGGFCPRSRRVRLWRAKPQPPDLPREPLAVNSTRPRACVSGQAADGWTWPKAAWVGRSASDTEYYGFRMDSICFTALLTYPTLAAGRYMIYLGRAGRPDTRISEWTTGDTFCGVLSVIGRPG